MNSRTFPGKRICLYGVTRCPQLRCSDVRRTPGFTCRGAPQRLASDGGEKATPSRPCLCKPLFCGTVPSTSEVLGPKPCVLGNTWEHSTPNLVRLVKSKGDVGPAFTAQGAMRTGLTLHHPANPQECRQHARCASTWPSAQAALKEISPRSGAASPCSSCSATTRRANAFTLA